MPDYQKRAEEIIENEWLNLGDTPDIETINPFSNRTAEDIENPHLHVLGLMRRPEYLGFTCKHVLNKDLPPIQLACLHELWYRNFPMLIGARGFGKTFLLAMTCILKGLLCQGAKVVVVGAGFRQAKFVFEACEEIWVNAPILRDICGGGKEQGPKRDIDRCTLRIGDSVITALPIGDGSKIRGQRANITVVDEFASANVEVYENVVAGFSSTAMSPVVKVKKAARKRAMKRLGMWNDRIDEAPVIPGLGSNQTIISGTPYYSFNHFYDYWRRWVAIVESKGDIRKLEEIFQGHIPEGFNWKDYSVIRVPVGLLPEDYMDIKTVAKARATMNYSQYLLEFGGVFISDSAGFFRRSLIESCVVGKPDKPIILSSGEVSFSAALKGNPTSRYVMAIDPASEKDNFSIVILELREDHRRIVYCWTTTRQKFKARYKKGLTEDQDFYRYCARKIRDLIKIFPCERIALDSQGGGVSVMEALGDTEKLKDGERPIYQIIEEDKEKDTDDLPGDHILEMINFARAEWVAEANHGMRKDFEDKALLFPEFDSAALGYAIEEDKMMGRKVEDEGLYDTLEDCMTEIEDLKNELATITHSQTGTTMRDKWDTPETKLPGGKKGRQRKDRYSALLMANMIGRTLQRNPAPGTYEVLGGFTHELAGRKVKQQQVMQAPAWYLEQLKQHGGSYGAIGRH